MDTPDNETRTVRSEDPSLSEETNARLTGELRDAVGGDEVEVSKGTRHAERERHATGSPAKASIWNVGLLCGIVAIVLGIVAVIAALQSGRDWVVAVALVLEISGLILVLRGVLEMLSQREKPSAGLEARMEEEGVANPEGATSDMADSFRDRRPEAKS